MRTSQPRLPHGVSEPGSSLLPEVRVAVDYDTDSDDARTFTSSTSEPQVVGADEKVGYELRATWDLNEAVFNRSEIALRRAVVNASRQRDSLVSEVTKIYFSRRRSAGRLVARRGHQRQGARQARAAHRRADRLPRRSHGRLVLEADRPVKRLIPAVALLAACIDTDLPPIDLVGPELASVEPSTGTLLPLDPSIRIVFSEPLARQTIEPALGGQSGTVLLMTRYKLDDDGRPELDEAGQPESNLSQAMITDLNAGDDGLDAASYFAGCVPSRVTYSTTSARCCCSRRGPCGRTPSTWSCSQA